MAREGNPRAAGIREVLLVFNGAWVNESIDVLDAWIIHSM